ncbi:MAG TPA: hypothetical protein PKZ76_14510 [Xanthomonadaceae bacterium]|nr:hypothetical protein [Xanthomonadaceae bacterium]
MRNFEDVRTHVATRYTLRHNDPYLISFDLELDHGRRRQSMFLAEIEGEEEGRYLRISTALAPVGELDPLKALVFNWEQRVGYLALSELEGVPYLHLCENRRFRWLSRDEIDFLIQEIGTQGDRLERFITQGRDQT